MPLTVLERKRLRSRAHALKPVVLVGDAGVSEALLAEASRALHDHELIKVRLPAVDRESRERMAGELCRGLEAEDVQAIGRVRVLFRERPPEEAARRPARSRARRQR